MSDILWYPARPVPSVRSRPILPLATSYRYGGDSNSTDTIWNLR
jgi:hypothetical protein